MWIDRGTLLSLLLLNNMNKKIVVIGGGNGSAKALRALKDFQDLEVAGVVSMSDSGGSSGRLREEFNTLPTGDVLRAVLSLSKYDYGVLKRIFYKTRFNGVGKLDKHNLGNLFLVLSEQYDGDFMHAVRALEESVEAEGHVYPVTLDKTHLVAELTNGDIIKTEGVIDEPSYDRSLKIKRAWLDPDGEIFEDARCAIEEADCIVIGPGSLYTSIVATLLPRGVREAFSHSKAKIIYVAGNSYTITGETGPERLSDFVKELQVYVPRKIDYIVHNNHAHNDAERAAYVEQDWEPFEADLENISNYTVVQDDFERDLSDAPGLDPVKLGNILHRIIT